MTPLPSLLGRMDEIMKEHEDGEISSTSPSTSFSIYCDLDGVLADFERFSHLPLTPLLFSPSSFFLKPLSSAKDICGTEVLSEIPADKMWALLASHPNFFAKLPWMKVRALVY